MIEDTIAAIATPPGAGGIAIVRVSGPAAIAIADRCFRHAHGKAPSNAAPGHFLVGHFVDGEEVVDQVLLLLMRAPHSYTCEDVVEFQGHGGAQCAQQMLRRVLQAGARLAEPGEFTQRAFLNGRLDLAQAEAVLDLIHARSERAAAAALDQLEGGLSNLINAIYDDLVAVDGDVEATLDFPEDQLPPTVLPNLTQRLTAVQGRMQMLLNSWDEGHMLRDGALIVISGKPNVGKSTLLNGLLGRDRAIVSNMPGTTRDTIEEDGVISGIPVRLVDTAGLRETDCEIERSGIERTHLQMKRADLHLYVIDASQPIDQQVINNISTLPAGRSLLIWNKMDKALADLNIDNTHPVERIIATQVPGIDVVKNAIRGFLSRRIDLQARPHATISARHRQLLLSAADEVRDAVDMLSTSNEKGCVLVADHLRGALELLGQVVGRHYHEELLDQIFARFCIGK